jgi:hypothetical protein
MPVLILDKTEWQTGIGDYRVAATMFHPADTRKSEELLLLWGKHLLQRAQPADTREREEWLALWRERVQLTAEADQGARFLGESAKETERKWITQYLFNPDTAWLKFGDTSTKDTVSAKAQKARYWGIMVGYLLPFMIQMQEEYTRNQDDRYIPSVNSAIKLLAQLVRKSRTQKGTIPPGHRSKIFEAWGEYKSVAHFWAAQNFKRIIYPDRERVLGPLDECREGLQQSSLSDPTLTGLSPLTHFLAVAEAFYSYGIKHISGHQRTPTPLLDVTTTWRCEVPGEPLPLITIKLPPLTNEAKNIINSWPERNSSI